MLLWLSMSRPLRNQWFGRRWTDRLSFATDLQTIQTIHRSDTTESAGHDISTRSPDRVPDHHLPALQTAWKCAGPRVDGLSRTRPERLILISMRTGSPSKRSLYTVGETEWTAIEQKSTRRQSWQGKFLTHECLRCRNGKRPAINFQMPAGDYPGRNLKMSNNSANVSNFEAEFRQSTSRDLFVNVLVIVIRLRI